VRLGFVGDLMVRTPGIVARHAADPAFQAMLRELRASGPIVANLEVPLSRRGRPVPKTINLRADPAAIEDVLALGVGAVTLANNHLMDYGPEAMLDTLAACDRAGLARCGAGADLDAALAPVWFEADGARVALMSVSCTLPIESDAGEGRPGVAPLRVRFAFETDLNLQAEQPGTMPWVHSWAVEADSDRVCRAIAGCRTAGADAVVVAIHWGVPSYWLSPYQGLLAEYQRPLAHALIDAGADAICGHHPHQLHPIEVYRGKPILYSLGNFAFEGPFAFGSLVMDRDSFVARFSFGERLGLDLVPLRLNEHGIPHRAEGDDGTAVLEKVREHSRPFGTEIEICDGIAIVKLGSDNPGR
jgi:poly-gamma-glutamate capsule biosynthesis protein CapA/YwtB (metallophosphatase superfamily)